MNKHSDSAPHAAGSLLSAVVGWAALNLAEFIRSSSRPPEATWSDPLLAVASAIVIFVVWLVALLPLYFYVPPRSVLWRWPICTFCGVMAGTLIALAVWCALDPHGAIKRFPHFLGDSLYLGGIVGGVTCLFGSLTAPIFRGHCRFDPLPRRSIQRLKERLAELSGQ